jgi:hypothetical protein
VLHLRRLVVARAAAVLVPAAMALARRDGRPAAQAAQSLADSLVDAAIKAMSFGDESPLSEKAMEERRDLGRKVAVAVLSRLGGKVAEQGLLAFSSTVSQQMLVLADQIEESGNE